MSNRELVCIPVSAAQLEVLAAGETLSGPLQAFSVNDELMATFGLTPAQDEEADYACLLLAGLWALIQYGRRLVVTAQIAPFALQPGPETHNGGSVLNELPINRVEAWFSDEDEAAVEGVAARIAGQDLDTAWQHPEVERLLRDHDLMWHSVVELGNYAPADRSRVDPADGRG